MKTWALHRRDYVESRERRKAFVRFIAENCIPTRAEAHELVFGELVTNAVRYGRDPMSVSVAVREGALHIQVENSGGCFDLKRELSSEPRQTGGRGLLIVSALVETIRVEEVGDARCRVTVEMPL
jgi:anti-sigma regulatory factor (Ser/Thr protein kinase)